MFAASCVKFKKWFFLFKQGTARRSITHYVSVALFLWYIIYVVETTNTITVSCSFDVQFFAQYQFLGDRVLEFAISSYVAVFWKTQYPSKQNQRGILSLLGCWDFSGIYFSVNLWGRIIKWPADKEDFLGEPPQRRCGWGCNLADDYTD